MKRCDKCSIEFGGDLNRCPLCQAELTGTAEPSVFPHNQIRKSGALALKVLAFATGVCLLIMVFGGHVLSLPGDIVLSVCLALIMNYLFVRNLLIHSPDFLRMIARYFLILLAIAAVWFIVTGNHIVTTFIIPGICMTALVFDTVLLAVFRDTFISGYAKYLLFDVAFGFTPLVFSVLGLSTWDVPANASALLASVFLLWLLVFMRKQLLVEIHKLFSV